MSDKPAKRAKRKGPGRPPIEIEGDSVREAARNGCTQREIARQFDVDESVIRSRFKKEYEAGRDSRRQEIRSLQMKAARGGNPAMLIWLGKNELEQTDKAGIEHGGKVVVEVTYRNADAPNHA